MFNLAVGGFDPDNFEVVVAGIVESIVRADANLGDGVIKIAEGPLQDANWNRSPQAYAGNPADERAAHEAEHQRNTDTRMTVLRLERTAPGETSGEPIAAITWFSSHATSVSNQNRLVSGDHKGLASYAFERSMGADYTAPAPFVAAFAQGDAGDVSPNEVFVGEPKNTVARPCDGSPDPECDDLANAAIHGDLQYARARELFDGASELLRGPVDGRLAFIDMEKVAIDAEYTHGAGPQHTCRAAIGLSIAAGAEDGVAVAFIEEGIIFGDDWPEITVVPEDQACHAEKTILLPVGRMVPQPWSPTILPAQVLRIGNFAIAPVPFEITTMSGSRLRSTVLAHLEGPASTGSSSPASATATPAMSPPARSTSPALRGRLHAVRPVDPRRLAAELRRRRRRPHRRHARRRHRRPPRPQRRRSSSRSCPSSPTRPARSPTRSSAPSKSSATSSSPRPSPPRPGEHVVVRFRGAHPRNNLRTGTGYLEVQRQDGDVWRSSPTTGTPRPPSAGNAPAAA
jgi:neutral ceramidase